MKKVIIILIALIALGGCKKNTNELIMVTEAGFAPYEYYDGGEVVGVDVDIAKEIAKYLGKTLVVKDIAFDSIINEVKTGKADFGAAGISYSEDRAKNVDFSINYSVSKQVVIVSNNSNINNVNSISNKKLAVIFEQNYQLWKSAIQKAKENGEIRQDLDVEETASMFWQMFFGTSFEESFFQGLDTQKLSRNLHFLYSLLKA